MISAALRISLFPLVKTADPLLASKAAYLASFIKHEMSVEILKSAAKSKYPEVRVAAASSAKNLDPDKINEVLSLLKNDKDPIVRKHVEKTSNLATKQDYFQNYFSIIHSSML